MMSMQCHVQAIQINVTSTVLSIADLLCFFFFFSSYDFYFHPFLSSPFFYFNRFQTNNDDSLFGRGKLRGKFEGWVKEICIPSSSDREEPGGSNRGGGRGLGGRIYRRGQVVQNIKCEYSNRICSNWNRDRSCSV